MAACRSWLHRYKCSRVSPAGEYWSSGTVRIRAADSSTWLLLCCAKKPVGRTSENAPGVEIMITLEALACESFQVTTHTQSKISKSLQNSMIASAK